MRIFVLISCLLLLGCGRFDSRTRAILRGATKVEVLRVDHKNEAREELQGERRMGGYLITAQGADQGKEFADRLAAILLDGKTYTDNYAKCFYPGVGYRVWKDKEVVEILICFRCDNLYCGPPTNMAIENGSFHGSPRRADLLQLTKEAFPDDKDIEGLKVKGTKPP